MAEYVSFDTNVEVHGQGVQSTLEAIGDAAIPVMKKHDLYPVDPTRWYPLQNYLDMYKELNEQNLLNLVAIGMKVPDTAEFPPHIKTIDDALNLLNDAYQMNHRGGDFGEYVYERTGEREAKVIARNPFPSDLDYGIIYRLVQKFHPHDSNGFYVYVDQEAPSRKRGDDSCTYIIKW